MELLLKFHCGMGTQDDETAYHDLSFGFDEADVQFYDFMVQGQSEQNDHFQVSPRLEV